MNTLMAALGETSIINAIVWIVCVGLIFYLLYWLIGKVGVPEPFNKIAYALLALVAVVICIKLLMRFAGNPF